MISWWIVLNVFFHILCETKWLFAVYFVEKIFYSNIFYFKYNCQIILFVIRFDIKQLQKLWKKTRHFKLFTNCHVSWDTLYLKIKLSILSPDLTLYYLSNYIKTHQFWLKNLILDVFNLVLFHDVKLKPNSAISICFTKYCS